ncbi:predicted protein [Sclerotinia sclerotiorum 1980 UF-70]|uniref:Uncharacterized protein n=1 Tax=Sclerotinia sclerotiorum (strain ATCC 18683 / 1980 / Ss-1) TaxID=665079 RepID=A7EXB5_SCLS1|nr:predicted protein [Sclerotinia sclerotiorum 1980 UF-70]EDN94107.1 predicted protein [Sclerotinia sclerotiorum 1980 UF-70]
MSDLTIYGYLHESQANVVSWPNGAYTEPFFPCNDAVKKLRMIYKFIISLQNSSIIGMCSDGSAGEVRYADLASLRR